MEGAIWRGSHLPNKDFLKIWSEVLLTQTKTTEDIYKMDIGSNRILQAFLKRLTSPSFRYRAYLAPNRHANGKKCFCKHFVLNLTLQIHILSDGLNERKIKYKEKHWNLQSVLLLCCLSTWSRKQYPSPMIFYYRGVMRKHHPKKSKDYLSRFNIQLLMAGTHAAFTITLQRSEAIQ